jgi:hypothetical protein
MNDYDAIADATREICCPFCKKLLVRDYETSELFEEQEEALPEPVWDIDCPHVAAYCVWGYVDFVIAKRWADEVNSLCKKLQDDDSDEGPNVEVLESVSYDDEGFAQALRSYRLPGITLRLEDIFVCKNDGPTGEGGPRFIIVLMDRRTIGSRSRTKKAVKQ